MKILNRPLGELIFQTAFLREIEALASLQHPATLRLLGFDIDPAKGPRIVTDLMPNGTLGSVLQLERNKRAPPAWNNTKKTICIFGICAGMAYVHSCRILHRDLKPDNIFLNDAFEPVIGDFGASRDDVQGAEKTQYVGTPLGMAPELIDGEHYTASVDVYSFAVTLFSLFAQPTELDDGRGPFNAHTLLTRVKQSARFRRPPGEVIPDYLWGVIVRCWEHAPDHRPSFQVLVDRFRGSDDYLLPGADVAQVREYEERMLHPVDGRELDPIVLKIATGTATPDEIAALRGRNSSGSASPVVDRAPVDVFDDF